MLNLLFLIYDFLLSVDAWRDIKLRRKEKLNVAVPAANKAQIKRIPEGRTILAIVQDVSGDIFPVLDSASYFRDRFFIGIRRR